MFLYKHFVRGGASVSQVEDVCRNLTNVLGSKRGSGYFLSSFGLNDVGYRTPEEMVTKLSEEISENVRLYEPRVELLDVDEEYDDDGSRARLVVKLRMRDAAERLRITIDLKTNRFEVQPVAAPARR